MSTENTEDRDDVECHRQTQSTSRIDYLDIVGRAASTRTVINNWRGFHFVEYQHLHKSRDGEWKITSKTFASFRPEA